MSVRVTRRSRLVGVLLPLVLFVLAGCKIDGTIEFQANGGMKFNFIFEDSRDTMVKINRTCESVQTIFLAKIGFVDDPKVEDVTPAGGHLTCRVTSDKPFKGNMKLTERDGKYHFKYYGAHDGDNTDLSRLKTRIVVSMPGKVTRSSLGKVQGNKVIVEGLDFLDHGVEITAEKKSAESAGSASSPSRGKKAGAVSPSAGGFPVWGWAAIGGGVLVVIAGCAFVWGRRRGAAKAAVASCQNGMPTESRGVPLARSGGVPSFSGEASAAPQQQAFSDRLGFLDADG